MRILTTEERAITIRTTEADGTTYFVTLGEFADSRAENPDIDHFLGEILSKRTITEFSGGDAERVVRVERLS